MQIPDAARRAIRTFVQAFTATILLQVGGVVAQINEGTWVPDLRWLQRILLSALIAGGIALVAWLHNFTEDAGVVPSVLKSQASSGANPVTQDPPA